ncbi:hypothetical protein ABER99_11610 [Paenibacillus glucanolyticus]|jgi:hypothetical protein|uniref:hypothetical protein n=2 Tax=Paenibacillus TaxID=44249 RepID=UPI0003E1F75D|nr:hypothetical protein [Paenibacillus glucanolyticus]ANA79736.1 hypothetical protein A3958_07010 [Paenibacillus glucanolyticus]ETT38934.1 abortive infection protein [Paenibacillus sp. FSL R5-808]
MSRTETWKQKDPWTWRELVLLLVLEFVLVMVVVKYGMQSIYETVFENTLYSGTLTGLTIAGVLLTGLYLAALRPNLRPPISITALCAARLAFPTSTNRISVNFEIIDVDVSFYHQQSAFLAFCRMKFCTSDGLPVPWVNARILYLKISALAFQSRTKNR